MKQYIGISVDHSGSMASLARQAARDYNSNIEAIKTASKTYDLDTIVSTVKCGVQRKGSPVVERGMINSSTNALKPIPEGSYETSGFGTPLFDSVGELIEILNTVPDADHPEVSYLVLVVTDGYENISKKWSGRSLGDSIRRLTATDRWTFAFRVPRGNKPGLIGLGIPEGNILEWDQTQEGLRISTEKTVQAFDNYYKARSRGEKATSSFFTDLRDVKPQDLKRNLADITREVTVWPVTKYSNTSEIRTFVEGKNNGQYLKGAAFYELTKSEKVQPYKQIIIRDRRSGKIYGGAAARDMLGLPRQGDIRLRPGDHSGYEIFVQSTSVNRKLVGDTNLVYWPRAAVL